MYSYFGMCENQMESLILFEAAKQGLIATVNERLTDKQRREILSGAIYIWDERKSGIKRWTDGISWSNSRVAGPFLEYRQTEADTSGNGGFRIKPYGLRKRTLCFSWGHDDAKLHLICYYTKHDARTGVLPLPSSDPRFSSIIEKARKGIRPKSPTSRPGSSSSTGSGMQIGPMAPDHTGSHPGVTIAGSHGHFIPSLPSPHSGPQMSSGMSPHGQYNPHMQHHLHVSGSPMAQPMPMMNGPMLMSMAAMQQHGLPTPPNGLSTPPVQNSIHVMTPMAGIQSLQNVQHVPSLGQMTINQPGQTRSHSTPQLHNISRSPSQPMQHILQQSLQPIQTVPTVQSVQPARAVQTVESVPAVQSLQSTQSVSQEQQVDQLGQAPQIQNVQESHPTQGVQHAQHANNQFSQAQGILPAQKMPTEAQQQINTITQGAIIPGAQIEANVQSSKRLTSPPTYAQTTDSNSLPWSSLPQLLPSPIERRGSRGSEDTRTLSLLNRKAFSFNFAVPV